MAYFASQRLVNRHRRATFRKSASVAGTSEQRLDVADTWSARTHLVFPLLLIPIFRHVAGIAVFIRTVRTCYRNLNVVHFGSCRCLTWAAHIRSPLRVCKRKWTTIGLGLPILSATRKLFRDRGFGRFVSIRDSHGRLRDLNEAVRRRTLRVRVGERFRCDRDNVGS
jgi:hypothetical protein